MGKDNRRSLRRMSGKNQMTTLGTKKYKVSFFDQEETIRFQLTVSSGSFESAMRMAWIELTKAMCVNCREIRTLVVKEQ